MGFHFSSLANVSHSVLLQDFTTLKHHNVTHATQLVSSVMVPQPVASLVVLMTIFISSKTNA
jgi:hypothetical protein